MGRRVACKGRGTKCWVGVAKQARKEGRKEGEKDGWRTGAATPAHTGEW